MKESMVNISEVPEEYTFVSDSQDSESAKESILGEIIPCLVAAKDNSIIKGTWLEGLTPSEIMEEVQSFDSFFILVGDGAYIGAYGMNGTVPYCHKNVYLLF